MKKLGLVVAVGAFALSTGAAGHPGGLNAEGCHNDRKNGGYHCHRPPAKPAPAPKAPAQPQAVKSEDREVYFANCTAARAAGAAPIRRGQPGYGRHLDRDGDGVACE